jgi:hypothetical protein
VEGVVNWTFTTYQVATKFVSVDISPPGLFTNVRLVTNKTLGFQIITYQCDVEGVVNWTFTTHQVEGVVNWTFTTHQKKIPRFAADPKNCIFDTPFFRKETQKRWKNYD